MQRLISLVFASAIALATIGSGAGAQSSVAYQVQDLIQAHSSPDYEVPGVGAYAINNGGVVVGFTADDAIKSSPFYTVDGKPKRVKTGEFGATFAGINASGVIAGREVTGRLESGAPIGNPAIWIDEEMTRLEIPANPFGTAFASGAARAINDSGLIIGDVQFVNPDLPDQLIQFVVAWQYGYPNASARIVGTPSCQTWGLSESGLIGGQCWDPNAGMFSPIVWSDFVPGTVEIIDILNKYTSAITDFGDGYAMVGYMESTPEMPSYGAFAIIDGAYSPLFGPEGLDHCAAWSVVETPMGLVIGGQCMPTPEDFTNQTSNRQAVVWINGVTYSLDEIAEDAEDWHFIYVRGINAEGQLVGLGERNGERRSFVMTPA